MMVYDCFTFFNELDLLEIRLNILSEVVDKFVIVEADRTFTNNKKPFNFQANRQRYAPYLDKIIYVKVEEYAGIDVSDPWTIEEYQRNRIMDGLRDCKEEDVILIADLDEIPNPKIVSTYREGSYRYKPCSLSQGMFYYYLNYKNVGDPWKRAKVLTFADMRMNNWTPQNVRQLRRSKLIRNGGWHFSYMGGGEAINYKIQSFSHQEVNTDEYLNSIDEKMQSGKDLYDRDGMQFLPVPVDNRYMPEYLVQNQEKYANMFSVESGNIQAYRLAYIKASIYYIFVGFPIRAFRGILHRLKKLVAR
jgi:beta-1,4-mannosyl-glycoprotein beta-1,4-N-acetylglucosaminyltransferase